MSTGIPIIPNNRVAMQILIAVLEDGTPRGKQQAKEALMEMAGRIDALQEALTRAGIDSIEHVDLTPVNTPGIVGDANKPNTEIHTHENGESNNPHTVDAGARC